MARKKGTKSNIVKVKLKNPRKETLSSGITFYFKDLFCPVNRIATVIDTGKRLTEKALNQSLKSDNGGVSKIRNGRLRNALNANPINTVSDHGSDFLADRLN